MSIPALNSVHRNWCVEHNHPGMTYNTSMNKTWCACGEVITEGNTDTGERCCGWTVERRGSYAIHVPFGPCRVAS